MIHTINYYINNLKSENGALQPWDFTIEQRLNNEKRSFLFVNKKMCKHIPNDPKHLYKMSTQLAHRIYDKLDYDDNVLVIGMAETATAIAHIVARELPQCSALVCTTRKQRANTTPYLVFEEEHSHAPTHIIYEDLTKFLWHKTHVIIVDDEITTGKTAQALAAKIKDISPDIAIWVASLLNTQPNDMDKFKYVESWISLAYAERKDNIDFTPQEEAEFPDYSKNSSEHKAEEICSAGFEVENVNIPFDFTNKTVRVIGTEEYMYLPMLYALEFKKRGANVLFHSTTRSPIAITSLYPDYIHVRAKLPSFYGDYWTYLYNFDEHTDATFIVTDSNRFDHVLQAVEELSKYLNNFTERVFLIW